MGRAGWADCRHRIRRLRSPGSMGLPEQAQRLAKNNHTRDRIRTGRSGIDLVSANPRQRQGRFAIAVHRSSSTRSAAGSTVSETGGDCNLHPRWNARRFVHSIARSRGSARRRPGPRMVLAVAWRFARPPRPAAAAASAAASPRSSRALSSRVPSTMRVSPTSRLKNGRNCGNK